MLVEIYGERKPGPQTIIEYEDVGWGKWDPKRKRRWCYTRIPPINQTKKTPAISLSVKQLGLFYNLGRLELDDLTQIICGLHSSQILQAIFTATETCDKDPFYAHMKNSGLGWKSLDQILEAIRELPLEKRVLHPLGRTLGDVIIPIRLSFPSVCTTLPEKLVDKPFREEACQGILVPLETEIEQKGGQLIYQTPIKPLKSYTI